MRGDDDDDAAGPDPVAIPIEDALDLHAFAPRDVAAVVADYLEAAHARGFGEVRLIHGRGIGVQRSIVHALLARHPLVAAFRDAPPDRGGFSATIVALKPSPPGRRAAPSPCRRAPGSSGR